MKIGCCWTKILLLGELWPRDEKLSCVFLCFKNSSFHGNCVLFDYRNFRDSYQLFFRPGFWRGWCSLYSRKGQTLFFGVWTTEQTLTENETPPQPCSGLLPPLRPSLTYENANMSKDTNNDWVIPRVSDQSSKDHDDNTADKRHSALRLENVVHLRLVEISFSRCWSIDISFKLDSVESIEKPSCHPRVRAVDE
jgi:hypothetical protein